LILLVSGAVFGLVSLLVIIPATNFGGFLAVYLSRRFFRDRLYRFISARKSWDSMVKVLDESSWVEIAILRFHVPIPNFAQNYILGLTSVPLSTIVVVTFLFSIPHLVFYVAIGATGRAYLIEGADSDLSKGLIILSLLTVGCLVALVVLRLRARRAVI
jgi:uncharacterized membrane protein YdjX (TVP38/TMEM64 family)